MEMETEDLPVGLGHRVLLFLGAWALMFSAPFVPLAAVKDASFAAEVLLHPGAFVLISMPPMILSVFWPSCDESPNRRFILGGGLLLIAIAVFLMVVLFAVVSSGLLGGPMS